jgi:hypothetical protein
MSVLENQNSPVLSNGERAARQIRRATSQMAYQLIQSWNHGWDLIWSSEDPGAVLAELGTDAAEIFELNEQLVAYFVTTLTGRRQEDLDAILAKVAAKPATTIAEDGSVTIDVVEEPEA